MNRALIPYMRKSSGEDPAGSLARQRGAIHRWAEANGVELAPEVWEPGISGSTHWRDRGLGEAVAAVERGDAAGIVVEEQSRLTRGRQLDVAELWEALERAGARLVCTAEGIDTAHGDQELNFGLRALLAREQWKQYKRRMDDVKAAKLRDGLPLGPVPFGYRRRPDRRVEVDPDTAPVVRELYERRAAGQGGERLAEFMDERAPRPRGRWSRQAVAFLLQNPMYHTGRLHYGGVVSEWDSGAIVDAPLWQAVQPKNAKPAARPRSPRWLLTGLAVCGSCGACLEPHTSRPGGPGTKPYHYMRCMNRSCDARRGASAMRLEAWVMSTLWMLLGSTVFEERDAPDLGPLVEAVAVAQRRLDQVDTPEAMDALGDGWVANVKARRLELEDAEAALGKARVEAGEDAAAAILDLRERWPELDPGERRERLHQYAVKRVIVNGPKPADWELMLP
jgi:DNA invertase Pin-like site-specific DNA recombinase